MKIDDLTKKALNFEDSKAILIEKQIKSYKIFSIISISISLLSLLALCLLIPLKEVIPYVVQVDKDNGDTRIITALTETKNLTVDEAVDKFNVVRYITAREGYIFETLRQDYDLVVSQTDEKIVKDFIGRYQGTENRAEKLKDVVTIKLRVKSVVLTNSNDSKVATVRLQLIRNDLLQNVVDEKSVIVTMSYDYAPEKSMSEQERYDNPFGFYVTSYRVNNDNE